MKRKRRFLPHKSIKQRKNGPSEDIHAVEHSGDGEGEDSSQANKLEDISSQAVGQKFTCEVCNQAYQRKQLYTRHMTSHLDPKSLVCDICYKVFGSEAAVSRHMREAHNESSYVCICSWSHTDIGALMEHKKTCTQHALMMSQRKKYRCEVCNLTYTRLDSLRKHEAQKHSHRYANCRQLKGTNADTCADGDHGQNVSGACDGLNTTLCDSEKGQDNVPVAAQPSHIRWKLADQASGSVVDGLIGKMQTVCSDLEVQCKDVLIMVRDGDQLLCLESTRVNGFLAENSFLIDLFLTQCRSSDKNSNVHISVQVAQLTCKAGVSESQDTDKKQEMSDVGDVVFTGPTVIDSSVSIGDTGADTAASLVQINDMIDNYGETIVNITDSDVPKDFKVERMGNPIAVEKSNALSVEYSDNVQEFDEIQAELGDVTSPADIDKEEFDDSADDCTQPDGMDDSERKGIAGSGGTVSDQEKQEMRERMRLYGIWLNKYSRIGIDCNPSDAGDNRTVANCQADPGTYLCTKCGSCFLIEQHFKSHQLRHSACDKEQNRTILSNRLFLDESVTYRDDNGAEVIITLKGVLDSQTTAPYQCLICKVVYPTIWKLFNHIAIHCRKSLFSCNICERRYRTLNSWQVHMKKHYQRPYDCDNCRMLFINAQDLQQHREHKCLHSRVLPQLAGSAGTNLSCEQCSFTSNNKSMFDAHMQRHAGKEKFQCQMCDQELSTMSSLARHLMLAHQTSTPFTCEICSKSFKVVDSYRRHLKTHQGKTHKCETCGKGFSDKDYLRKHMKIHTGDKPFVCDICGEAFARNVYLNNHRWKHTGETPYYCTFQDCDKGFRSRQNLRQHMRTHDKVGTFTCDICGRTFKQPGQLNHHRKNHTIEWRWPCKYCEEKFKSCWTYKRHLAQSHPEKREEIEKTSNIRLHKCTMCEKLFHEKMDLKRHLNGHLGIKPFHCKYCNKAFSDKSNLRCHEQRHAGVKKLKCSLCYKTFVHEKNLIVHMEKHKDEEVSEYETAIESVPTDDICRIVSDNGHVDTDLYGKLVVDQLSQFPL